MEAILFQQIISLGYKIFIFFLFWIESDIFKLLCPKVSEKGLFFTLNFAFVILVVRFSKNDWRVYLGANMWNRAIGLMSRVFTNGPGDLGSMPGRVIPKTPEMVLDAALLNTQHYKVRIKGKMEQSRKWSWTLFYTSV